MKIDFIDFVSKSNVLSPLSLILVVVSIFFIYLHGLNYGIDFAGGMETHVRFKKEPVKIEKVRLFIQEMKLKGAVLQSIGNESGREYLLRLPLEDTVPSAESSQASASASASVSSKDNRAKESKAEENRAKVNKTTAATVATAEKTRDEKETTSTGSKTEAFKAAFLKHFASFDPEIRKMQVVGPQIGSDLRRKGALAVFYSLLVILIYIAMRFDYKYAPGAVLCLFHDVVITLSLLLILGKEMNLPILAAILMLIGYSLNDTIVMYDRIRENSRSIQRKDFPYIINKSINDMLPRTIITSLTTLLSVLALCLLARGVIFDIALCLGIGVFVGTYSSICVAAPVLLWMDKAFKE